MSDRIDTRPTVTNRFVGGPPLSVAFRLILLCVLVGVILHALGFDPGNIIESIRRMVQAACLLAVASTVSAASLPAWARDVAAAAAGAAAGACNL